VNKNSGGCHNLSEILNLKDGQMIKRILFLFSACILTSGICNLEAKQSEAVTAGDFLYVSGQYPIDPTTGKLVIDNIQHQLHSKGFSMRQVIKTEVYLTDIRNYQAMDAAYGLRFDFSYPPARDVIQVSNLLYTSPIVISCIAYKGR
jgi:2-iminobutanoate/2-iminopropanoate deaminase